MIAHGSEQLVAGGLDRVLALDDHLLGAAPGCLALRKLAARTQYGALFEIVEQVFFRSRIVRFDHGQGAVDVAGL
ncbi:hypothetical protein D3C80_2162200 [compost metagenome]